MPVDTGNISQLDLPYHNLVLTGFLGVGKTTTGQHIANRLGISFFDVDEEIELRELMSITRIRELYGDSRLRTLEHELCRHAALMRRSVIGVPGAALLDARNYALLSQTGRIVVLTCELGEALRRLHLASDQHFRDGTIRHRMLSRLRREHEVVNDTRLLQMDTTHLTVEEQGELLINYWLTETANEPYFRFGPPAPIKAPPRPVTGVASQLHGPAYQTRKPKR
jgi:shikimate kinase